MPTLNIGGKRVKVDDSFMSLSPEQQNATVDEIAQSFGGAPAAPAADKAPIQSERSLAAPAPVSVGEDVARSGATGLRQGIESIAGMWGDTAKTTGDVLGWGAKKLGASPEVQEMASTVGRRVNPFGMLPTTDEIHGVSKAAIGDNYEPQTTAGKYARTIGEFAPNAVAGPGGVVRKTAMAVVPAVLSEAAGQAAEGSGYEPLARVAGAVVGGGLSAGGKPNVVKQAAKEAPTAESLKSVTDNTYKALRDVGIQYHPGAYAQMVTNMATDLNKAGFRPSTTKQAFALVDDLTNGVGKAHDFDDINALVSSLGETARGLRAAPGGAQEAKAVELVRSRLMDLEETAPITSRIPLNRDKLNEVRGKVKEVAFRSIKDRALNEIVANADTYPSGQEAGIRNGIGNLLRSKRGAQMFKGEERQALLEVAQGRKALRTLSKFGFDVFKFNGNAATLPFIGAAATGMGMGPLAGGALAVAGTAAKLASPFFTGKALELAKAAIRSGKLRDNSTLNAATAEKLKANVRRLLATDSGAASSQ